MNRTSIIGLVLAVAAGLALTWWGQRNRDTGEVGTIKMPAAFSATAVAGQKLFNANCSVCHGRNGAGTRQGPPLVHIIYEPNHHGDPSFYRAVQFGVRQHHWPFGNMAPLPGVPRDDVTKIITYVRELQRANGIH